MDWHLRTPNAPLQNDTSLVGHMEPIVVTVQEEQEDAVSGGESGSGRIHLEKARRMELKDDTDVSLWPSQPSVAGRRPSRSGPRHVAKLVGGLR